MQKLETINKTEILTESEKKETTWTDKSGKKHPATQVKGDKYTGKEAEKDAKPKKDDIDEHFTSAIAQALVEEFGYEVEESTLTENPHASDPAKSAAWAALSPEDQKWLGGADPTDPAILARAPNKGKPSAPAPGGAATKPAGAPALVGTQNQAPDAAAQASRIADRMDAEAGANTAGQAAAPAAVDPAADQQTIDPAKLARFKELLAKAATPAAPKPTQIAPAPKKPATGASTKPSQPLPGVTGVPGAQISNTPAAESVTYEDDQILLAIKNVRF